MCLFFYFIIKYEYFKNINIDVYSVLTFHYISVNFIYSGSNLWKTKKKILVIITYLFFLGILCMNFTSIRFIFFTML